MTAQRDLYANLGAIEVPLLRVDLEHRSFWKGDERLHLTPREFRFLSALARRLGEAVPVEDLCRAVYGSSSPAAIQKARVTACQVRRKLGAAGGRYIVTVLRVGYKLTADLVTFPAARDLDEYALNVADGRIAMSCPRGNCLGNLLAGEAAPVGMSRLQQVAAWHELEHWAEAS